MPPIWSIYSVFFFWVPTMFYVGVCIFFFRKQHALAIIDLQSFCRAMLDTHTLRLLNFSEFIPIFIGLYSVACFGTELAKVVLSWWPLLTSRKLWIKLPWRKAGSEACVITVRTLQTLEEAWADGSPQKGNMWKVQAAFCMGRKGKAYDSGLHWPENFFGGGVSQQPECLRTCSNTTACFCS